MASPVALITGVTGQDGSILSQFLIDKGYSVHGIKRRSSSFNTWRIEKLYSDRHEAGRGADFTLHHGDMTDTSNLIHVLEQVRPDEIYNLAAQSHVQVSFETPEYTADTSAIGALRLLEAMRILQMDCRFYQASTSEMFGNAPPPQSETSPFWPCSPYATAKLYAYWTTVNYRQAYDIFASNGILFNHESPVRGETFLSRKVTRAVARIHLGQQERLYLGNLDAKRDWGHASDYVRGMWLILQHDKPEDYVLATGKAHSVRHFVEAAFAEVGCGIVWRGSGLDEVGVDSKTDRELVHIDPRYFRPNEVQHLLGNADKARRELGWEPQIGFEELVAEMVASDLKQAGGQ